jgi:hypothetical protein
VPFRRAKIILAYSWACIESCLPLVIAPDRPV